MNYTSLSDKDKKEMMAKLGITSVEELFRSIPEELRLKKNLGIPHSLSEQELVSILRRSEFRINTLITFLF